MAIVWADVVAIAPVLGTISATDPVAVACLAIADRQIDDLMWGVFADDGRRYLAAHLASIRSDDGFVTAETLGSMSRSYSLPPGVQGSFALSAFGIEYERLLLIALGVPGIVV